MASGAILAMGPFGDATADSKGAWDPIALYGGDIEFEIRRNGEPIGRHQVLFDQMGNEIEALSKARLEVPFGLFDYTFDYESKDVWENGKLISLAAKVDDDGDVTDIAAWRSGENLTVSGPVGIVDVSSEIVPTNHWNPAALTSDLTLNTITGEIIRTNVLPMGEETLETATGERAARKYLMELEREVELWYDLAGRWIGMRFSADDGSTIEYYCLRCGGDATESASR